jgi:hypothetical protein
VVVGLVVGVSFLCGTVFLVKTALSLWRMPVRGRRPVPLVADLDRARLTGALLSFFIGVMMITVTVAQHLDPAIPPALKKTAMASIFGIMLSGALHVSVVLFNRPGFVIPPHLRSAHGKLARNRTPGKP